MTSVDLKLAAPLDRAANAAGAPHAAQAVTGGRVLVIGSLNMDMVAHATRLPMPGETLQGERFVMAPGGKGANQAVAAARLGAQVAFVSRVGMQEYGAALLQALSAEGIDHGAVVQDPAALPGIAVIMVAREGGENSIVYVPGSNAALTAEDVANAAPRFSVGSVVVAQLEVPVPAIQQAFEMARAVGACTVLNAAPAMAVPPALLALCDWLILNETEAAQLTGLAAPEAAAQALLNSGPKQVLLTLGAQGVLLASAARLRPLSAPRVHAVDTVGAGDTFVGAFACGLAEGRAPLDAVRLGMAAAALAVSRPGVQQAMPRRDELPVEFSNPA
ncbi:ribokinase [Roseateles koreensis]|uniref:Ribokinase n=1 Tax=Roseateles koreensis TaxID=2987526 RepID=A0ABT5KVE8_9BURK|nr:ribokinase [Roseateles koreensis]MDC8786904.1 ribokinase [Roseateles koreensis]